MQGQDNSCNFYGWRIVAAAFVLAVFGWGLGFYGPPIYLYAVHETRGWPTALVATAISTHFLLGAFAVANLPRLYRHFGVAKVTKIGAVLLGFGVVGWAFAASPWQLFIVTMFSGAGWAATGPAAVNAILAPWFVRSRPAALSSAYNGASVGGIVFAPLWVAAIGSLGFPVASILIGAVVIVSIWILSDVFFSKNPEGMGLLPDGATTQTGSAPYDQPGKRPAIASLSRDVRFITLASGMALGLFAQIGLLAHLFSLLIPAMGTQFAGLAAAASTAAAVAGRTLVGWLMPPTADRRLVASASYAVQIAGSLMFIVAAGHNIPCLMAGVLLFGLGIGNATSLPPLIAQTEFSKKDVSRVVPLIVAISQAAYAFAPATFGLVREFGPLETTSGQLFLYAVAAAVQAAAIAMLLAGRQRRPST
jgi:MFS family permease